MNLKQNSLLQTIAGILLVHCLLYFSPAAKAQNSYYGSHGKIVSNSQNNNSSQRDIKQILRYKYERHKFCEYYLISEHKALVVLTGNKGVTFNVFDL
jgi:hypothetical protein